MQDIICRAGPYASHDLARKFTMKLSAARHAALRCGVEAKQHTYRDFEHKLIYNVQANRLYREPMQTCISLRLVHAYTMLRKMHTSSVRVYTEYVVIA